MTKEELLADLEAKTLKVVSTQKETDSVKEAAGVNSYLANVMEQDGDKTRGRNIGFYVIDEGDAGEAAYYRDELKPKKDIADKVENYLNQNNPDTFLWFRVDEIDEDLKVGRATVITTADSAERVILVYKDKITKTWTHTVVITL